MARVNVERMRRANVLAQQAADRAAHQTWLDSLTPEHRRIHDKPHPVLCGICMQDASRRAGESLTRALASIKAAR